MSDVKLLGRGVYRLPTVGNLTIFAVDSMGRKVMQIEHVHPDAQSATEEVLWEILENSDPVSEFELAPAPSPVLPFARKRRGAR